MSQESKFIQWWHDHCKLKHVKWFNAHEFLNMGASNLQLKVNTFPPRELWDNVVETVLFADQVRDRFGHPLKVLSAYRSQKYNKRIGGAQNSYHVHFMAVDLAPIGGKVDRLHYIAMAVREDIGHGGVGRYSWGVHIDSREALANW